MKDPKSSHASRALAIVRARLARLALETEDGMWAAFFGLTGDEFTLEAASPDGARAEEALAALRFDPSDPDDPLGRVVCTHQAHYAPGPHHRRSPDPNLRSFYATPVFTRGAVAGVLVLASARPDAFDHTHRALADALARTLGKAIEIETDQATRILGQASRLGLELRPVESRPDELLTKLTPRQREVVEHLSRGERPKTIARALHLSPHTVRNHLKHIYRTLHVHSQEELLRELHSAA